MSDFNSHIGLSPMYGEEPSTLILGSFPGEESINVGQYYANSRNMFWDVMEIVLGESLKGCYEFRCEVLKHRGIALWDVYRSVVRKGSLDSAITEGLCNDLEEFIGSHPSIKTVVLNGGKATKVFKRYLKEHPNISTDIRFLAYTSTSKLSLSAGWTLERISEQWKGILQ